MSASGPLESVPETPWGLAPVLETEASPDSPSSADSPGGETGATCVEARADAIGDRSHIGAGFHKSYSSRGFQDHCQNLRPDSSDERCTSESSATAQRVSDSVTAFQTPRSRGQSRDSSVQSKSGARVTRRVCQDSKKPQSSTVNSSHARMTSQSSAANAAQSCVSTTVADDSRRAASAPPRPWSSRRPSSSNSRLGSEDRGGSGSPPPTRIFKKQLSTAMEHATPPRHSTHQRTPGVSVSSSQKERKPSSSRKSDQCSAQKSSLSPGGSASGFHPAPRSNESIPATSSGARGTSVPNLPGTASLHSQNRLHRSSSKLEKFREQRRDARHLSAALGEDAKRAFRQALLQGVQQPRSAKLGFVGAARAGKTSTLRALGHLALRSDEESTPGLAVWTLSQKLFSAAPGKRWQLQDSGDAGGTARWDRGLAKFVADSVRSSGTLGEDSPKTPTCNMCSETKIINGQGRLDASVVKRMPVDLICRRLGERPGSQADDDLAVVLEAYDFGGQEIYYYMHHLFLSDYGIYLACLDLSAVSANLVASNASILVEGETQGSAQAWDALEWWLASLAVHAPNSPIAIVGTHDDCLDSDLRSEVHQKVHQRIEAYLRNRPELNQQLEVNEDEQLCFFPVDNSGLDSGRSVARLRTAIETMTSKLLQGPLGRPIPLRWGHFWSVLQREASKDSSGGPLRHLEELWRRCQHYGFESQAELQHFLKHFRGLGALLHFPNATCEDLRDLVCLKPSWVGEAAASILVSKDKVFQGCLKHTAELREKGMLHSELLSAVWRSKAHARYHKELLALLQGVDVLLAWGHDRHSQSQLITPRQQRTPEMKQLYLVPALLPSRPQRQHSELRADQQDDDAVTLYLDFHGLLHRLLPTLMPRLLCTLSRVDAGVQILSVYANFAHFAISTQGQAQGDSARSLGGRRPVPMLLVSLQPCPSSDYLRCCIRPRRSGGSSEGNTSMAKPSWRNIERLLHGLRDAMTSWMPNIGFKAGIRCSACSVGHMHPLDLHTVLRDELTVCPQSGELVEDLPSWVLDWRSVLFNRAQHASDAKASDDDGRRASEDEEIQAKTPADIDTGQNEAMLHVDYLYASPLDAPPLNVRAELEALAAVPRLGQVAVRTATSETLSEVWRTEATPSVMRVMCLAAHFAIAPAKAERPSDLALMLEDAVSRTHMLGMQDLDDLLALGRPEVAPEGTPTVSSQSPARFDVVFVDACHSEPAAQRFVASGGARCAVACTGEVFDAAAREFLRVFLRTLAASVAGSQTESSGGAASRLSAARMAFASAQRAIRLSPQPGLRSEAEHFRFVLPPDAAGTSHPGLDATPAPLPAPAFGHSPCADLSLACHFNSDLPPQVEDFVGRAAMMAAIAQAFLGSRRVVWLHGRAGIGKSSLSVEFLRYYSMPGDRLFSHTWGAICSRSSKITSPNKQEADAAAGGTSRTASSAKDAFCCSAFLQLAGCSLPQALGKLEEVLGQVACAAGQAPGAAAGRRLLVLDGVDDSLAADVTSDAAISLWALLQDALDSTPGLCLLCTSQNPRYDAPLKCKVVAVQVTPLDPEDASLLLLRRSHRPLFQRDFDAAASSSSTVSSEPLQFSGRRREVLKRLGEHPLSRKVGGAPADILRAASHITPQLPSLFAHPLLNSSSQGDPD
eukprot:TRINITY_DN12887_c0_g1_i1.p1 TRINITY_DN12887_c0_g1~~TRINITY_DN12887_c0_g1_i1.p1  ORF type:complete len:1648 (+),score=279.34 TRINITY_DN12887_c0_g1_i1:69-5012(+)